MTTQERDAEFEKFCRKKYHGAVPDECVDFWNACWRLVEEAREELRKEQIYAKEKDYTATIFMNQVKKEQAVVTHLKQELERVREALLQARDWYKEDMLGSDIDDSIKGHIMAESSAFFSLIDKALQQPNDEKGER